ncbi:MAG: hypothetical protein AAF494_09420 [Pseudomonadota bacterium]
MRARCICLRVLLIAVFGLATAGLEAGPALAKPRDLAKVDLAAERAAIEQFQRTDQLLQDVGWQLIRGNAPFCPKVIASVGLQLQDLASYGGPEIARAALGLTGDFAVQTAARGSPAALSGAFARNREIALLGKTDPNRWDAGDRLDWRRLTRVHDFIDVALSKERALEFGFRDGTAVSLAPVQVCATRFELMGKGKRAVADGSRVVIGVKFPGFAYEEPVFAGVVAHELAHNLLEHRIWLDRNGRKRRHVRLTEREADRLMPWLLANAGYDPQAAVTFMETWGPKHGGGLLRARTHDGWDERAEFIAAELPLIRQLMEREGKADWSVHFRREIDPDKGLQVARSP